MNIKKKGEGRKDIQKIYKDVKHLCAKVKCAAPVKRACAAIIIREDVLRTVLEEAFVKRGILATVAE